MFVKEVGEVGTTGNEEQGHRQRTEKGTEGKHTAVSELGAEHREWTLGIQSSLTGVKCFGIMFAGN